MRKRLISDRTPAAAPATGDWLRLDELAEAEISSEDAAYPIESALLPGRGAGWRAAAPGRQTIRLLAQPQARTGYGSALSRPHCRAPRNTCCWSADGGVVPWRQQWNFRPASCKPKSISSISPEWSPELIITPDIASDQARFAGRTRRLSHSGGRAAAACRQG
jgi:hypothetical protein